MTVTFTAVLVRAAALPGPQLRHAAAAPLSMHVTGAPAHGCRLWELLLQKRDRSDASAAAEDRRCSNALASTSEAGGCAPPQQHAPCVSGQHDVDEAAAAALSSILGASPSVTRELLGRKLGEPPRSLETLPSLIPSEINLPEKVGAHCARQFAMTVTVCRLQLAFLGFLTSEVLACHIVPVTSAGCWPDSDITPLRPPPNTCVGWLVRCCLSSNVLITPAQHVKQAVLESATADSRVASAACIDVVQYGGVRLLPWAGFGDVGVLKHHGTQR